MLGPRKKMLWFGTSTLHQWSTHFKVPYTPRSFFIGYICVTDTAQRHFFQKCLSQLHMHRCQHTVTPGECTPQQTHLHTDVTHWRGILLIQELLLFPHVFLPKSTREHCSCICHGRMPQTIFCCHFWQKPCCLTLQSIVTMTTVLQCLPITSVFFQSWVPPPPTAHREGSLILRSLSIGQARTTDYWTIL